MNFFCIKTVFFLKQLLPQSNTNLCTDRQSKLYRSFATKKYSEPTTPTQYKMKTGNVLIYLLKSQRKKIQNIRINLFDYLHVLQKNFKPQKQFISMNIGVQRFFQRVYFLCIYFLHLLLLLGFYIYFIRKNTRECLKSKCTIIIGINCKNNG